MKIRFFIGVCFLLLQIGGIVYARFVPERFFCWAPYDSHTKFEVLVTINGRTLSSEEASDRYHYKMKGWEQRSIHNIISLIRQYERSYGKNDHAEVTLIYATNGHPEQTWIYNESN
ncbi:MAG: DUF3421 domain-containing protein [Algicola sp.]|nr:DUF3421 domain-containing protein [Algicola sp.]